jgi:hypothetical protein
VVSGLELHRGQISGDAGFEVSHQCGSRRLARCDVEVLVHESCEVSKCRPK